MKKHTNYILLLPCSLFLIITLGFGIGTSLLQSLGFIPSLGMNEFTLKYYVDLLSDKSFISSLYFSIKISFISSSLSLLLGIILAYIIYRKYLSSSLTILKIPIIIPHIVVVIIVITIFSQVGIISRILYSLGIINSHISFPLLVNDPKGIGIILTYLWKEVPFIALVTFGIMSRIDKGLVYAAKSIGANEMNVFFRIILPIAKKGIITNFLIIFAFSFSSFEVPYLIGPTSPKALSVKAYLEYSSADLFNRPYAMTLNVSLVFIALIILFLYQLITRKSFKEEI